MNKFVLLVSIFLLVASGQSEEPGFRIALTSKGLDYSKALSMTMNSAYTSFSVPQVGIPILEKELASLNIPDISGSAGTPVGSIDYDLKK